MENEDVPPKKEKKSETPLLISFLTEFFGTAILMWMGCLGCIEGYNIGPVIPAFSFGLAVTSAIQIFAHISPVHINPAVTVGVLVLGKIRLPQFAVYLIAQYSGALAGYGLLQATMPYTKASVCLLIVEPYMDVPKAFFVEFFATMILMFVVASISHPANEPYQDSLPLKLGLVVSGLVFAAAPFTGACLNPARSLPPCVMYNNFKDHWLYQLGPYLGMATSATIYRFVFDSTEKYSLHSLLKRHCAWCYV